MERCLTGNAPTLKSFEQQAGKVFFPLKWLEIQLVDLAVFCGVKEKFTDEQLRQSSEVIMLNFSHLKLTELMIFFQKLKSGEYGKFYGVADPMAMMENLQKFKQWRNEQLYIIYRETEKRIREEAKLQHDENPDCKPIYLYKEWEEKKCKKTQNI
jgi:hypothetical protein